MPFVQRTIEPKHLSRKSLFDENGKSLVSDYELEAIANNTLTNVLRQLASLVLVANDIFEDLARQLAGVYERSCRLKTSIEAVEGKLVLCDPKTVTVPESDICTFSLRTIHFKSTHPLTTGLFTNSSRPNYLQKLYESAAPTPVHTIRQLDRFRRDGSRSSKFFVCTPVLGARRKRYRKIDLEIETRKPMAVEDLRRWTSSEALGDITVLPDNTSKIPIVEASEGDKKDEIDHLLPSPEEQMMAVALKFPPSIVAVDISGKPFERMSGMRRSLTSMEVTTDGTGVAKRRTKRRHREKRRNTIAGTSQKEIQQAIAGETTTETEGCEFEPLPPLRSKSTDLFKLPKTTLSPTDNIKNHFNTLKNWSKTKLKFMNKNSSFESCKPSFQGTDVVDDIGIYETLSSGSKHKREKERKPSSSSSAISIPASTSSIATNLVVKLRENSLQRRSWRKGTNKGLDEPAHSSSGNWSASSESGRTSIASETTAPPKSSTTTSNNSLNHHNHHPPPSVQSRRRYLNNSTSSSVSEGTLTPDINDMQYHDLMDGETSSVYSCDTEGYYTSFHMDSGLKTLKEEEIALSFSTLQIQEETSGPSNITFNNTSSSGSSSVKANQLTAENEYELFGKGSTSTTTSSAGTVCTTLPAGHTYGSTRSLSQFAPAVPERKSSLERKTEKKQIKTPGMNEIELISDNISDNNDELESTRVVALIHDSPSPDSGHNTSSSPAESEGQNSNSPHEHLEFSESDVESCDRNERIRNKTAMTTCRIPSMCMITPPQSDDEVNLRSSNQVPYGLNYVPLNHNGTIVQNEVVKNNFNGKIFAQSNGGKPLHIQIPKVPDLKKEITDIYAYPDKTKKTKANTVKTVSTNGVLETNLDNVAEDGKDSLHLVVNGETGYATIKNDIKKTYRSPSPNGGLTIVKKEENIPKHSEPILKPSLLPSNFMDKFREVLNKQKKPEKKNDEGDYVMIVETQKSPKTDMKHSNKQECKSEYVSLNDIPATKNSEENPLLPSSNDSSLERKKRQGARVTLDSEGKVVYSSDSLKRKKQHTTFIPGKYVRESPTPSPLLDKRVSKPIRPVNCSGLIRTNSDERKFEPMSPQLNKVIIKAGSRNCESPKKDYVRTPPARVVTPTNTPKRIDKGARVILENGQLKNRSVSPASSNSSSLERKKRIDRCISPSSSSSSSSDAKKPDIDVHTEEGTYPIPPRWISQHPAVIQNNKETYSQNGFPRNHPMYWTLPARRIYGEENQKEAKQKDSSYERPQNYKTSSFKNSSSSQQTGAMEPNHGLTSLKLVQKIQNNEFTSSTPTKEPLQNSKTMNLGNGMSPILKETLFNPKSKMTAEEIFAAIHKSKKKLNIKEDMENRCDSPSSSSISPDGSECSFNNKSRERSSWSPNSCDLDAKQNEPRTRRSWIGGSTPINSFKKLLLQQGIKNPNSKNSKISAVEQLKLSKQNNQQIPEYKTPPRSTLNTSRSRVSWRFNSPRTDVLSSTIHEDCSEGEKSDELKQKERVCSQMQSPDHGNLSKDYRDARYDLSKPRENRSLEITKKYLQQARKNFFNEPVSPNTVGLPSPARKQLNFSNSNVKKLNEPIMPSNFQNSPIRNYVSSSEKKKTPIISLETAL